MLNPDTHHLQWHLTPLSGFLSFLGWSHMSCHDPKGCVIWSPLASASSQTLLPSGSHTAPCPRPWQCFLVPLHTWRFPLQRRHARGSPGLPGFHILKNAFLGRWLSAGRVHNYLHLSAYARLATGRDCLRSNCQRSGAWVGGEEQ